VPGIGPKKAYKLVVKLGLTNAKQVIDDLFNAAKSGRIAQIEGFGQRSQQELIQSIESFKRGAIKERKYPLIEAMIVAQEILDYLKHSSHVIQGYSFGQFAQNES